MNHNIQKVLSYLGLFSKRLGVFASFLVITSFIFISSENKLFANEGSVTDKITFIAFDVNYKDESDFSFSKDIISHIVKFHSLDSSEKIILKPYGNKSYPSLEIKRDEIEINLEDFFKNIPYESSDSISNHYLVISEGFTKIAELKDTSKSNFYLISNLDLSNSEDSSEIKLKNLSDLYLSSKIRLNVLSLPSSNSYDRDLFMSFSQNTNGDIASNIKIVLVFSESY